MRIVETLQQDADDIIDCRVIFHGDQLKVHSLTQAITGRVVEPDSLLWFGLIEPIAGLHHLQMNIW